VGGSVIIHTFGAFFGLGCTMVASPSGAAENPDNSPRYNADVLCMVGVILNWMTFPSFNAYFAPVKAQQAVVVNTYLSQFSSCVAAMVFSSLLSGQFKLDPSDVQRSSIAGGVAISSVSSLFCQPWEAMLIGSPPSDLFSRYSCCYNLPLVVVKERYIAIPRTVNLHMHRSRVICLSR
jgi:ammonium transporter Rh